MRVSGAPLRVGGGEDGVDEDEGADDLRRQPDAGAVAVGQRVGAAAVPLVQRALEGFHEPDSTYGSQALRHHVHHGPNQRHFTGQEKPERHCWVYVSTYTTRVRIV